MRFAAEHGIHAAFFGVDSTRAEPDFYRAGLRERDRGGRAGGRRRRHARHRLARGRRRAGRRDGRAGGGDVPVHFHGHNDFGVATASAVAAVRAGATYDPGHDQRHGRARRQRQPRRGRAGAPRALRRRDEPPARPDPRRLERVRELSGYELEPWKPRDRRDALPARERRGREPVPRPAVDRAVLLRARRDRARDRPRQEERPRLDPDQGRRARPRRARGPVRRPARAASRRWAPRKRGLVTDEEFVALVQGSA